MKNFQPNPLQDLKTLSQVSYVIDGKLMVIKRKNQPEAQVNFCAGGHRETLDLAEPPLRELREEAGWYERLITGKP